ncbi:hypothetical protein BWI15_00450 [Kribbella sp. ALI-6-A]|nr:hypothetical protein BWI15_00450 [Kribbella sp. ALI-6-A]
MAAATAAETRFVQMQAELRELQQQPFLDASADASARRHIRVWIVVAGRAYSWPERYETP